jgi:ABC-type transporter Mla maintaining outer membrane lipid asymmetry permease subunit MlaE
MAVLRYFNNNNNNNDNVVVIIVPAAVVVVIIMPLLCCIVKHFLYIPPILVAWLWTTIQTTAFATGNVPDLIISFHAFQYKN